MENKNEKNIIQEEMLEKEKLEKHETEEINVYKNIENLRVQFIKNYKKDKAISLLILFIFVGLMVGVFVMLLKMPAQIHITFLCVILLFVGTFFVTKKLKSIREKDLKTYITNYRELFNDELYKDERIKNIEKNPFMEIEKQEIIDLNIFNNFQSLKSNDLVKGKFDEKDFYSCSSAIFNNENKIIFYGKIFSASINTKFESKIVVSYNKGDGEGIKKDEKVQTYEFMNTNFSIYTLHTQETLLSILPECLKTILHSFNDNEYIKDMTLVLKDNQLFMLVSCKPDMIDVALNNPFDEQILDNLKNVTSMFFNLISGM